MSLKRITLKDFVIVKHLELDLSSGFSVLSGETGAGKSILIDAIQLALGSRAESSVIREGATKADISLEFDSPSHIDTWLDEQGFGLDDGQHELLVRRVIEVSGKSRAWINASPATASQLKELADQLIDIHGQHAWQCLTRPNSVRILLDAYAGISTTGLTKLWDQWRASGQALAKAKTDQEKLLSERDRLIWQISEVDKLAPQPNEWPELNAQHTRLANAQTLIEVAQKALTAIQGEDSGADQFIAIAQSTLESNSHLEAEFGELSETLASASAQIADVAHSLQSWLKRTDLDPEGLAELDERLSLWLSLARRYKRTPEELPALYASWKSDLQALERSVDLNALEQADKDAQKAYSTLAAQISAQRGQSAPLLSNAITEAMQGLGMQGGRFLVQIEKALTPSSTGVDEISFLVAAHSGSTPRPVAKVASGGELSRISLAIAVTTSQLGEAQTLIFDEVDSGIGGAVAQTVGRLMKKLGIDRQVLAVTHLPQVAACADHHWVVSKSAGSEGTLSQIHSVEGSERVNEIARMLGGERITEATQAHAKEMLEEAEEGSLGTQKASQVDKKNTRKKIQESKS
jgi:DNA repair protein RecN (Recombination protein N)